MKNLRECSATTIRTERTGDLKLYDTTEREGEPLLQHTDLVGLKCQIQRSSSRRRNIINRIINRNNRVEFVLLSFVTICATVFGVSADGPNINRGTERVGLIFDSQCPIQLQLYKAVWMGFRDTILCETQESAPLLIDTSGYFETQVVNWIHSNRTTALVSLLDEKTLGHVLDLYSKIVPAQELRVVLPRSCVTINRFPHIHVECLKMSEKAVATALVHRIIKVGTRTLIPVLDSSKRLQQQQLRILQLYKNVIESNGNRLALQSPILGTTSVKKKLMRYSNSYGNETNSVGLLILSRGSKALLRILDSISDTTHHAFSPYGMEELLVQNGTEINSGLAKHPFGVYTIDYAGSTEWDNPARRRILAEFNAFIGPHPLILTAALSYDAAARAVEAARNHRLPLTGPFDITSAGTRASGVFFGLTPKPASSPVSLALLLQPSDFILQDIVTLMPMRPTHDHDAEEEYAVVDYQVSTSSVLSKEELLTLALVARSKFGCSEHGLEVTTHDPFNQLAYSFNFLPETLPAYLLIPNQYGYGLELSCQTGAATTTSILIACTPNGQSLEEPVHCFRSNPHQRTKRHAPSNYAGFSQTQQQEQQQYFKPYNPNAAAVEPQQYYPRSYYYPYTKNYVARDDNANNLYYQPPAGVYGAPSSSSSQPPSYYGYPDSSSAPPPTYYGYQDSSTSGYLTTRLDIPINEEPPSTTPASPTASKLPELRQVLKAAKPFVGSCVGSTTGCAVCVLVLGRLPLGAVPAACTGPCFVGTFGSCGSLLGRVFSETTIICTELFKQGHLDITTFIADAEFGRLIAQQSPETLKGYQFLATPLVHTMQTSILVTNIVAKFAVAWAHHMQYLMGHNCSRDWMGEWIHAIGTPLCSTVGYLINFANLFMENTLNLMPRGEDIFVALLAIIFLTLLMIAKIKLRKCKSK